ncbi:hypothetical protein CL654_00865 [bacterium]|nr:hypothetical protein [bacterium]|tara:strand:- start:4946 stop:5302 length:357 start_codon:yes stop_codon:yes gene_type:complete
MTTPELIVYIQKQREFKTSDADIQKRLKDAGWHDTDIQEGFKEADTTAPEATIKEFGTLFTPLKITEHDLSETKDISKPNTKKQGVWILLFFVLLLIVIGLGVYFFFPGVLSSIALPF